MQPIGPSNTTLQNMLRTGTCANDRGEIVNVFPAGVSAEECKCLYALTRELGACHTLETGLAFGLSALSILEAHDDNGGGGHITIDPYQSTWCQNAGLLNIKRAGLHRLHRHYDQPSFHVLPELHQQGRTFQLIFLDGSHQFELAFLDTLYADLLLDIGGFLVLHDSRLPSVRKILSYLLRWRSGQIELVKPHTTVANPVLRAKQILSLLPQHYKEPALIWTLSAYDMPNMVVLRKLAHYEYSDSIDIVNGHRAF